jgi:hypothetical protein
VIGAARRPSVLGGGVGRTLEAGLYRVTDLRGRPTYWLLPRQPARFQPRPLQLSRANREDTVPLRPLRPGFYRPVWAQQPFLSEPMNLTVSGDQRLTSLLFPKRDFWVLTEDPEDPAGCYATWSRYVEVGQRFTVICREGEAVAEMRRWRDLRDTNDARLLDWEEDVNRGEGLHEFLGCMVLSYELRAIAPTASCQALLDAIVPRSALAVSLSGGLRDPNQAAWLEGFPPTIKIYGFAGGITLSVTQAGGSNECILNATAASQEPIKLDGALAPGMYRIEAASDGAVARRIMRIIRWEELAAPGEPESLWNTDPLQAAGLGTCGAAFIAADAEGGGA